jgi:aminoglycoside 6'-N-acetyltransferase I
VEIRVYQPADEPEWRRLRRALWPDLGPADAEDAAAWLAQPDAATFVAVRPGGGLAGFAEFAVRPWAEGCGAGPVAYLEGWYVDPDARRAGVGATLVRAGEAWARGRGLGELASDALIDNTTSHRAHLALGFAEVERVVFYRKPLADPPGG